MLDTWVEEAFAQNALADHAGATEEDDVHVVSDAGSRRKGLTTRRPSKSWPDCRSSVRRKRQEADFAAATMRESQNES